MKKNKITLTAIALCAIAFTFFACSSDDGDGGDEIQMSTKTLDIKMETDGVEVDVVKLVLHIDHGALGDGDEVLGMNIATIAEAPYSNGGFKINIPDNVDYVKYLLEDLGYKDEYDDLSLSYREEVTVSNKNVKGVSVRLWAFKDGNRIGRFYYERESGDFARGTLVYVDSDVRITGAYSDSEDGEYSFNETFKKGWNWEYRTVNGDRNESITETTLTTITSTNPGGLKWFFEPYEDDN